MIQERIPQMHYLLQYRLAQAPEQSSANFGEPPQDEVRRITLPRIRVNKGKKRKGRGSWTGRAREKAAPITDEESSAARKQYKGWGKAKGRAGRS